MEVTNSRGPDRYLLTEPLSGSFGSASIVILNVSSEGAKIEHAQPIRLGTRARLWFKRADIAVSVTGLVVWSHLSKTPNDKGKLLYNSGLRLENAGAEFGIALQALIDRGIAKIDDQSLDRKKQRQLDRTRDKNSQPHMKILRQEDELPGDQVLLIQHARERLRSHPEEALRWYNRVKFAIAQGSANVATDMRNREDILAVWEYLERSIDIATIARVFEKLRVADPSTKT